MSTDQYPPALTDSASTPNPSYTCIECRARNLRCESNNTEESQACDNCRRFGVDCSKVTRGSTQQHSSKGHRTAKPRPRIQRACEFCRKQRTRCPGGYPCEPCHKRNLVCEYERLPQPGDQRNGDRANSDLPSYEIPGDNHLLNVSPLSNLHPGQIYQAPAATSDLALEVDEYCLGLDKSIVEEYITAFFKFVYHTSCMSFLHQATFLRLWHMQTIHLPLLKAVCGCALRTFAVSNEDTERATEWMHEVELDALQNVGDLTIPRLQVLVLLAFYEFTFEVHSKKVLMLSGLAARFALIKQLNHEDEALSVVEQESRRRLMWSIFVLDKFCSGGFVELTLLPAAYMHIRLPGNERCFSFGMATETHSLDTPITAGGKDMGEFAYMVRLLDLLRGKIHRFTKRVVSDNSDLYSTASELQAIDIEIDSIEQRLPGELKWTKSNLLTRAYLPDLTSYVMLHTWLHQCKCDLYRLSIPGIKDCVSDDALQRTPFDHAQSLRLKCLSAAISLAGIWADVLDLGLAKPVNDPAVAGCAYQCAKVITLVADHDPALDYSRPASRIKALHVCERISEPLKDIYPKASILYDEIRQLRSSFGTAPTPTFAGSSSHAMMTEHNNLADAQVVNEEQVRNILGRFNG